MLNDPLDAASSEFKRFHLGCGPHIIEGFLNIDGEIKVNPPLKDNMIYRLEGKKSTAILQSDLRNGIPANNASLEKIYHCHFLEHLNDQEGRALLQECYRSLKIGGVMRIAVPDFQLWCHNYLSGNDAFFEWYRATYLGNLNPRYKTKASIFMGMLYNWGHKISYDFDALLAVLVDVGFTQIKKTDWGISEAFAEIGNIEGENNPRRIESLEGVMYFWEAAV